MPNQSIRQGLQRHTDASDPLGKCRAGQNEIVTGGANGFTAAAGILRTDVTMNKELGRCHIQLFGDVFADFDRLMFKLSATL